MLNTTEMYSIRIIIKYIITNWFILTTSNTPSTFPGIILHDFFLGYSHVLGKLCRHNDVINLKRIVFIRRQHAYVPYFEGEFTNIQLEDTKYA